MTTWAVSLLSSRLKTFQITWKASVNKSQCQIRTNLRSPADCHSVTPSLCFQTNKNYGLEAFYILYEDWNHWFQWFGLRKSVKSAKGDISTVSTRHQSNSNPWNQSQVMMIPANCQFNHDVVIRCQTWSLILFQFQNEDFFLGISAYSPSKPVSLSLTRADWAIEPGPQMSPNA